MNACLRSSGRNWSLEILISATRARTASASRSSCVLNFMSAPPGDGCVGASILPWEAAGTQAQHAAQNRISLALANRYPAGSPLWHLFNNFYRHALNKAERERGMDREVAHAC